MKILILGATGFLGRNLTEYFAGKHELHLTYHQREKYEADALWHFIDLREGHQARQLFNQIMPDVVLQMAAGTSGVKDTLNDPAMHICNNAVMNSYILRAAVQSKVKHVIFPSCSVMYPSKLMITENEPPEVRKQYLGFASTKLYCEALCEFYSNISETKFTVMRNSNFYGAHDKFDLEHSHVFGASVTKVMQATDSITVWGTGEEARDFVHISDFCRFVEMAIAGQQGKFELYNCGSGTATTVNELVQMIIAASGKTLTIEHDVSQPSIPTSLSLDATKANAELGWSPTICLQDGIASTIEWWKENVA